MKAGAGGATAGPSSRVLRAFVRNPLAMSGLGLFGFTLLVAVCAPALAPDAYDEQNVIGRLKPPMSAGPGGRSTRSAPIPSGATC